MSGYVRTFQDKDKNKENNKKRKWVPFRIEDHKLSEKYTTVWTMIKDLNDCVFHRFLMTYIYKIRII